MNTPAHLILGAALFTKPDAWKMNVAALIGAFLPDFSLYFMVFWYRVVKNVSANIIFRDVYFSDFWQTVFAIDNSFFIWGALLGVAFWLKNRIIMAFAGAGLVHISLDFPLHHDDGRAHFWPLSDWIFESPVSYWDPNAHGGTVALVEIGLCLALLIVLWRRFSGRLAKAMILLAGIAQVLPGIIFNVMFSGGL